MRKWFALSVFLAAGTLAACGGGGGGTSGGGITPPGPTSSPVPQGNLPLSEKVGSSSAWVDPASHKTLYVLDVDTPTGATCTGQCVSIWPLFVPSSSAAASGNMTIITRSDGAGKQWAYQNQPLYTFSGDSGPDQANGDNFPDFGGHWHVARPNSAATPSPGSSNPPCSGVYC